MSGRWLVSGAAGLIGHELCRQLLVEGRAVLGVDDLRKGGGQELEALAREHEGRFEHLVLDVAAPDFATSRARLAGPFEVVVHLAAIVGVAAVEAEPWRTVSESLRGTLNAIELARAVGARALLFASSSEVSAAGVERGLLPVPTPEDAPLVLDRLELSRRAYAAAKAAGEAALLQGAREAGFRPGILRLHNVYGPRMQATHVIPEFARRALDGTDPFPVRGPEQSRSFLFVEDCARAIRSIARRLLEHARPPSAGALLAGESHAIWNVGSGEEIRIEALARRVLQLAGRTATLERLPAPQGSVARRLPDVRRLASLGFRPQVPLDEGLRQMLDAWRARLALQA